MNRQVINTSKAGKALFVCVCIYLSIDWASWNGKAAFMGEWLEDASPWLLRGQHKGIHASRDVAAVQKLPGVGRWSRSKLQFAAI